MKYLVVSDIHGKEEYIDYLSSLIDYEKPNKIIILGDIMSSYYNQDKLLEFLLKYKDNIILIKGNCDFPLSIPYEMLDFYKEVINGKVFLFTHGHLLPYIPVTDTDVLVSGHTHEDLLVKTKEGTILFNPGSIASPRGNSVHSYGYITDEELIIKEVGGDVIKKLNYIK